MAWHTARTQLLLLLVEVEVLLVMTAVIIAVHVAMLERTLRRKSAFGSRTLLSSYCICKQDLLFCYRVSKHFGATGIL